MCNPAEHRIWDVVARRAHARRVEVWGIISYLKADDPIFALLSPQDRVQVIADWSGLKPLRVALVIAALEHSGIVVDGRIAEKWSDVLRQSDDLKTDLKIAADVERAARRKAANRRYYLKCKAERVAARASAGSEIKIAAPSETPAAFLEENREQIDLFPSDAREQPKPACGWGVQAEIDSQAKAARWLHNTLEYARERMSHTDYVILYSAAHQDERPRWAQQQLDEFSRRRQVEKAEQRERPPDRRQRYISLPIPGGRRDAPAMDSEDAEYSSGAVYG